MSCGNSSNSKKCCKSNTDSGLFVVSKRTKKVCCKDKNKVKKMKELGLQFKIV